MKLTILLAIVLHLTSVACVADGLVSKIPPTGQWVSFNVTTRIGHEDGTTTNSKGVVTVRCLAKEKIDGKECRWIEFEHSWEQLDDEKTQRRFHSSVKKIAVIESALAKGFNPARDIVRGLHAKASANHKPERWKYNRVTKIKKGVGSYTGLGAVDYYLRPSLKNPMNLQVRKILVNDSSIKCTGLQTWETIDRPGEVHDMTFTFSQWKNSKVPFGVVEYQFGRRRKNGTKFDQKLTMKDSGKNAAPSIAETE